MRSTVAAPSLVEPSRDRDEQRIVLYGLTYKDYVLISDVLGHRPGLRMLARHLAQKAEALLQEHPTRSGSVLALLALAEAAPAWVVANASSVVPRSAIGGVLRRLPERWQRRAVVQALAPWPASVAREQLAKSFWSTLPIAEDERAELMRLIRSE